MDRIATATSLLLFAGVVANGDEGASSTPDQNLEIEIDTGVIQGSEGVSREGKPFYQFLGIPYGKVEKRFAISQPVDPWTGVKNCANHVPGCLGYTATGKLIGIENCLTVDVYVPKTNNTDKLPVMVYIFGGGFTDGNTTKYRGHYFMDQDVVLVIVNYRLNILGFLNAGVESARGNQGLKDQILALHWIQRNIQKFKGHKDNVTIFGQSAGAVSISLMTVSPMAKGLFHKVILQSGTSVIPYINHGLDGPKYAKKMGQALDVPTGNMEYLVECLSKLDFKVMGPHGLFMDELGLNEGAHNLSPSIETYKGDGSNIFLPDDPYKLAKDGKFVKVPIMMGLVSHECLAFASYALKSPSNIKKLRHQWSRRSNNFLYLGESSEDPGEVAQKVKDHFFSGDKWPLGDNEANRLALQKLQAERLFDHPHRMLSEAYAKYTNVYFYNFNHKPLLKDQAQLSVARSLQEKGAKIPVTQTRFPAHADELPYLFNMFNEDGKPYDPIYPDHEEFEFSKALVALWVSFAKNGKPNPGNLWRQNNNKENEDWKPLNIKVNESLWEGDGPLPFVLQIDNDAVLERFPESYRENHKFWNELPTNEFGKVWESERTD